MKDKIILKLGGSLLYKDELTLDKEFLRLFVNWFKKSKENAERIIIIVGGGKMSRYLVDQTSSFSPAVRDQHRIGMAVTDTNAEIVKAILNDEQIDVPKTLGQALEMVIEKEPKYVVSGGFKEGWSTDMDAVVLAHVLNVKKVFKLSNIDHVYTADPRTDPDARVIKELSWEEYFTQFGIAKGMTKHKPGMNVPVGAFCAQFAAEKEISFMLAGGENIKKDGNLALTLDSGTLIHP